MKYQPSLETIVLFYKSDKLLKAEIAKRIADQIRFNGKINEQYQLWRDLDNYVSYHKSCIDYSVKGLEEHQMIISVNQDLRETIERVENYLKTL